VAAPTAANRYLPTDSDNAKREENHENTNIILPRRPHLRHEINLESRTPTSRIECACPSLQKAIRAIRRHQRDAGESGDTRQGASALRWNHRKNYNP
jgi:hypothetical protein